MILLTGVTGQVGRATAECLLDEGVTCRGLARDPQKAADLQERGLEVVQGDLKIAGDVVRACRGSRAALLVTPNGREQAEMERFFAEAAVAEGVGHLVKISTIRAAADATAPFPRIHHRSEEFIKSLGLRWTMLRGNFFMQNFLMSAPAIASTGAFTLPMGKVRLGMIDARDVAEMAARCLQDETGGSSSHDISGQVLLNCQAVAERMSAVLGREVSYIEQPLADFRSFVEGMIPDPWHVDAMCALFKAMTTEPLGPVTDDSVRLLGRQPRSLDAFLRDHVAAFAKD